MIQIKELDKYYGKNHVLKDIDLSVKSGGIYAVLGPNGSGKTTLIKTILGLVIPQKGEIKINNSIIKGNHQYRNDISYLPQIANFPGNLKAKELINLVKDIRNQPADEKPLIDIFNLEPELNKRLRNLSGGTKQKINMVLGFMFDTPILILDEPTTGLDPVALAKFKKIIRQKKEEGKTILYTTHIMSLVEELSDEIIFLLDGEIYFKGKLEDLLKESKQDSLENAITSLIEK
jgi:Cu-processing system ATP-binding protein